MDQVAGHARTSPTRATPKTARWPVFAWLALYAVVALLAVLGPQEKSDLVPPAVVVVAFSVWGFLRQGGPVFNASAVYCYSSAVFVAFPAAFAGLVNQSRANAISFGLLFLGLTSGVIVLVVVLLICPDRREAARTQPLPATGRPGVLMALAAAAFAVALVSRYLQVMAPNTTPQALGALAILMLALAYCQATTRKQRALAAMGILAGGVCYYSLIFAGFGRLVLGAIACGVLAIHSFRRRRYVAKLALLAGTAPAIALLAIQRLHFLAEIRDSPAATGEGIASVTDPFISLARIIQAEVDGIISPTWGSTVWAALVSWVPREWWPGKPIGFGAEMVGITQPGLLRAVTTEGFSDAATILGEIVWNVGVVLFPIGAVLLALWLRWLDHLVVDLDHRGPTVSGGRLLLVGVLVASTVTLTWAGTFMTVARSLAILVLIVVACTAARLFSGRPPSPATTHDSALGVHDDAGHPPRSTAEPPSNAARNSDS